MDRILLTSSLLLLASSFCGCVSVQEKALAARQELVGGDAAHALAWADDLALDSSYSKNLGAVEAGRVRLLTGDFSGAETWFRQAVDSAVDRNERAPKIKVGDVGNTLLASTVTDDRTREYYLAPYELNLALEYAILTQALNGRREDALVDARLAVYVQDNLAETYGADVQKGVAGSDAKANQSASSASATQTAQLVEMMAASRNSWENPVLWWLTGVLFEADGAMDMAWQSYRKARAVCANNAVFARDAARADAERPTPARGRAKLVILYEEGFVPLRESLKIPVPLYTGFGIDIPMYQKADRVAYRPNEVAISGATNLVRAAPALDVRALAARDLSEQLPGVILRNITRAAVQAGAQAAANAAGNEYAQLAVFIVNLCITAAREADTRSWATLPDGQQVWSEDDMAPGTYQLGVNVNGRTISTPVTLAPNETKILWLANLGRDFRTGTASLSENYIQGGN